MSLGAALVFGFALFGPFLGLSMIFVRVNVYIAVGDIGQASFCAAYLQLGLCHVVP